jgi:hypothetical protein
MIPFLWGVVASVAMIAVGANYAIKRGKKRICPIHGELKDSCSGCRGGSMWD